MAKKETITTGLAAGRMDPSTKPGPEQQLLSIFIGKWINEGQTVGGADSPALKIVTSDVYEWMPGGFFVIHTAYGLMGGIGGGGIEIMGYDAANKKYKTYFFDGQGNITTHDLMIDQNTCMWQGENTRCTAIFTENGTVQTAHHERLDENGKWVPSMEVVLTKVE